MTGVRVELLVEFAVILLAPIIHTFYLWKYKRVEKKELVKSIKIFSGFYVLFGFIGVLLILK
jgi:hypothetical protein